MCEVASRRLYGVSIVRDSEQGRGFLKGRGKLIGLLFWSDALFFVLYNYIISVFAVPLNVAFLLYIALVTMSVYTPIGLVASIDGKAVQQRLSGAVPERLAGGVLGGLGLLLFLRVIGGVLLWRRKELGA